MLNGTTTRPSTQREDAEPWPGGSARPVLHYLTATVGMTDADALELLKTAPTAQAGPARARSPTTPSRAGTRTC
jgi:hypothetical protein